MKITRMNVVCLFAATILTLEETRIMNMFKDMDDNQYWLTLWTLAFTALMAILALIAYANAAEDANMKKMIAQGHDPLELACLFRSGSESVKAPCLLIGQAKAKTLLERNNVPE